MSNISERLEQQADLLFNNVAGWERNALQRIGRRVKDIKSLSYADLQAINNAAIVKRDVDAILKELATLTGQSSIEVKKIYAEMIEKQHEENKALYDYRGKPFIPLGDNKQLQAIVRAYARTTAETMVNLSMTKAKRLGFVDKNNNFVSLEKNFKEVLDKAVMSITTGTGDFNSEMRDVLRELGGSGLRVDYGGGVTRRLDTMVRQNLLWGAKQASVTYNEMIGEELGCDGVEIDWHSNPRPSHEFMQGKQYALGKARVINGRLFESADDALNALNDYGCLHFKTPIICGVSEPRYSNEELAMLNAQNARKIQIDGVSKTGYEWKQTMRKLENEARKTQDQIELLKASGDNEGVRQLKSKLAAIEDKYNLVAKGSGIKAQPQRMSVIKSKTIDNSLKNGIIKEKRGIDMHIDKFTPCLEDAKTGEILSTSFSLISKDELKQLKGWKFDWLDPELNSTEIYKLTLKNDDEIQGLVALSKLERDKAVYINIVEAAPHNLGADKQYNGVGGHLYAIAVQKSLENGYGGFVFMDAKNIDLVKHYEKTLGAVLLGRPHQYRMFINEENAQKLIEIYTLEEG